MLFALLAALGFVGGFLSGLLGIGGGIVLIPLLLYVPPLFGVASLDIRHVAGITIVQVFAASLLGFLVHRRRRTTNPRVVHWMGPGMVVGAAIGGAASKYVTLAVLEGAFVLLALAAAPLLFVPPPADEVGEGPARDFSRPLALGTAVAIGVLSGLVGVGGAFLVIPIMIYFLGVPTRVAIGSSLGVLLLSSLSGVAAKLSTGQIVVTWAAALCVGAVPGSWIGATLSRRVSARGLRLSLAGLVAVTAVRMLVDLVLTLRLTPLRPVGTP
ncbi:MAG: sulfite exporter TauE/SafE family protein [Candidatus Rokubacteria bacterium]|nr:sulfite exporter TauE/SafE family protein [Candidatus Rokubacteria bacterium]